MAELKAEPQYAMTDLEEPEGGTAMNGQHDLTDLEKTEGGPAVNSHHDSTHPSQAEEGAQKPAANPWMDPKAFPDGGAKAWLTVAGASACLFVSFGWINCIGVFQEYYSTHQLKQYSASDVAWIPALQSMGPSLYSTNINPLT